MTMPDATWKLNTCPATGMLLTKTFVELSATRTPGVSATPHKDYRRRFEAADGFS